jgi:hypothetical protein
MSSRRANANAPTRLAVVLVFQPHELRGMKHNERSAAGNLGGFPKLENRLLELTDPDSGICALGPEDFTRLIVYMLRNYGSGGPNGRVRAAAIPALRRAGIDLCADWRAPADINDATRGNANASVQ